MRRTPVYDRFDYDGEDGPDHDSPANVRRISAGSSPDRQSTRPPVRPLGISRRPPPKRGPNLLGWFVRGSIGVALLGGLWLGLQTLFPMTGSQEESAPAPTVIVVQETPANVVATEGAAPTSAAQATAEPQGDRLPGMPTPGQAAQQAAPVPATAPPAQPTAAPTAPAEPTPQPTAAPVEAAQAQPAPPAADAKPTLAPIPPPEEAAQDEGAQADAQPEPAQAEPPAPAAQAQAPVQAQATAAPAPRAQAQPAAPPQRQAPPPAPASGGAFSLSASASPANPLSENAVVTVSVTATQGGAPVSGAVCVATIYYRTATARQPAGGFRTGANGVGSFTLDARGTTYGYYIPIDVTCNARAGSATARTGFTPVKGR